MDRECQYALSLNLIIFFLYRHSIINHLVKPDIMIVILAITVKIQVKLVYIAVNYLVKPEMIDMIEKLVSCLVSPDEKEVI